MEARRTFVSVAGAFVLFTAAAPTASAQGTYVNFEEPQVKPLAVARVEGHDYLLVCNTPANAVIVYDTWTNLGVAAVPVGMAPVSILWNASAGCFYTANFIGDSVSRVELSAPGGVMSAKLTATVYVGDEPADLAISPSSADMLLVTLNGKSSVATIHATTLATLGVPIPLGDPIDSQLPDKVLKEPRRMIVDGGKIHVLGFRGDNSMHGAIFDPNGFDFDMLAFHFTTGSYDYVHGKLGSVNAGMAFGSNGDLFVVGSMARTDKVGKSDLKNADTGFLESRLWVMPGGITSASVLPRDLNRAQNESVVSNSQSVSMPTDIALLEADGKAKKVFIPSFHTDRIVMLRPTYNATTGAIEDALHWERATFDVPAPPVTSLGPLMAGPRAVIVKTDSGTSGDPGVRVYCLNRLDNSVSVLDPGNVATLTLTQLARLRLGDPTPLFIKAGRRFLYDARPSLKGMVSCASCHIDGRTDGKLWILDPVSAFGTFAGLIPLALLDGIQVTAPIGNPAKFPGFKGAMMTQSLQGLVNHPTDPGTQTLFSNRPYHWRGDKPDFVDFNEAFVNLLGFTDLGGEKGLTDAEMIQYRDMINTIMYPPNPEQPHNRRIAGTLGTPNLTDGTGALRGMKLFHTQPIPNLGNRSCVGCHQLGDGSNNRITLTAGPTATVEQPIESAAIRGLVSREPAFEVGPTVPLPGSPLRPRSAQSGLLHEGTGGTINGFITNTFLPAFPPLSNPPVSTDGGVQQVQDLIDFVRTYDWGIGPFVGIPITVSPSHSVAPATITSVEEQVKLANCGLVVYLRESSTETRLYFDVTLSPPAYRIEGTATTMTQAAILAAASASNAVAVFQATPLGSERRMASATGVATEPGGPAPSNVTLLPMRAPTQWLEVAQLTKNWPAGTGTNDFNWTVSGIPTPISLAAMRIYQDKLISVYAGGSGLDLGVHSKRHEPTRRLAVDGDDIRPGAVLELQMAGLGSTAPPTLSSTVTLKLELHPRLDGENLLWETTAEADPQVQLILLNGGPNAPDVQNVHDGSVAEGAPNTLDPTTWDLYGVRVVNSNGAASSVTWQRLKLQ